MPVDNKTGKSSNLEYRDGGEILRFFFCAMILVLTFNLFGTTGGIFDISD
jgi:hypothetical protein